MKLTTRRWGNSLGLRIPAPIARDTHLAHGSEVDLQIEDGKIVLTPVRRPKRYRQNELIAGIHGDNLPADDIWGRAVGREIW
jgi:antitoxin MazE